MAFSCLRVDKDDKGCHTAHKKNRCDQLIDAIKLSAHESVSVNVLHFVNIFCALDFDNPDFGQTSALIQSFLQKELVRTLLRRW